MSKNKVTQNPPELYNTNTWAAAKWKRLTQQTSNKDEVFALKNGYVFNKNKEKNWGQETDNKESEQHTMEDLSSCTQGLGVVSGVILALAFIFTVVGIATPFWFVQGSYNFGLFEYCNSDSSVCVGINRFLTTELGTSTWRIVTGLEIAGASMLLIMSACLYCFLSHNGVSHIKASVGVVVAIFIMLAASCVISGLVVMTSYYVENGQLWTLNWSYYLTAVGAGLSFLAVCTFFVYIFMFAFASRKKK